MSMIETDLDDGTIDEDEAEDLEYDDEIYLDKFKDPFKA